MLTARFQSIFLCSIVCVFFAFVFSVSKSHAQECNIIYVTPSGAVSGTAGTKANPASLLYGLTLISPANNKLYLSAGTYNISNPINMPAGIAIEGGFNSSWEKSNGGTTTIFRDNANTQLSPPRLVAFNCNNVANFRLQDLTIRVTNAVANGISTYGVYLNSCSDYKIVRCKVIAGNAGGGNMGVLGAQGIDGATGVDGEKGSDNGACCRLGGAGGTGAFPGGNAGGRGGNGGIRGTYEEWSTDGEAFPGDAGSDAPGVGGGMGGGGGLKNLPTLINPGCARDPNGSPYDGRPGSVGANGVDQLDALPGAASFAGGFYAPGNGAQGDIGTNGFGGGGGGGGGSEGGIFYETIFNLIPNRNGTGAGGGGGGEGGQGGAGGTGGQGAGGSFGIYTNNNGANGLIRDCSVLSGMAGIGGPGGPGGPGGLGGAGGIGGGRLPFPGNCDVGAGGDGGDGGRGGKGGKGGKGSDGISVPIYQASGGTPVTLMNVNSLQQPIVSVKYSGCTTAPVEFSTTATGSATWYFGAGSSPTSGPGLSAVSSYNSLGRKTFTLVINGIAYTYSDFIDISTTGTNINPTINSTSDTLCAGQTGTFTSSITASNYTWELSDGVNPPTVYDGPSYQTLSNIPFDISGDYLLTLKTSTQCCGISFPDTFTIHVDSVIMPDISIQSDAEGNNNIVCDQALVTFTATSSNVGNTPTYQWQVNGTNSGTNSPGFFTSSLNDADVIRCIVTSSLGCASGIPDTSNSITISVIDIPVLTCSADSFYATQPTYFSATVVSGGMAPFDYLWNFGDDSQGFGETVAHIYQEPGNYTVNVEVIDANGCASACSTIVNIASLLTANFSADTMTGCAPFTVNFTNRSTNTITYLWEFGDGSTSTEKDPSHTYISPGNYNVTLWAFGGPGNASRRITNQVVVYASPVAAFQAYPLNLAFDTVYFADNSVGASTWNWNFGDPASGSLNTSNLQNPTHIYGANGAYTVSLIVSNPLGCRDTMKVSNFIEVSVGVSDFDEAQSFKVLNIYPQPFSSLINFELSLPDNGNLEISLYDIKGSLLSEIYNKKVGSGRILISWSDYENVLSTGLFMVRINYNGNLSFRKVVHFNE